MKQFLSRIWAMIVTFFVTKVKPFAIQFCKQLVILAVLYGVFAFVKMNPFFVFAKDAEETRLMFVAIYCVLLITELKVTITTDKEVTDK